MNTDINSLPGTTSAPARPLAALAGSCEVHHPTDESYDAARLAWNLAVDLRPAAVAVPRSADEVVAVVRSAREAGLRVVPMSTGHGASPLGEVPLDDAVLVRMSELTGVTVDPVARTARVIGGTLWQDVVAAAALHGLTALHGSAGDVAVVGYLLGGGVSFYGRQHGLAVNSLTAVEVVTADGSLVRASADEDADLFWALRGGGGNLGVVVALEMELLPYADVFAGMLLWDRERATEVVPAWAAWTREVPESVTTSLRVMSFPPLPDLPPFLSGRDLVVIDGALLESDDRAADLLAPLRALEPELDTFARIPAGELLAVHMDPPEPVPSVGDHAVLGPLDDEAVATFLAQVGPGTSTGLLFAELRHLGGALGRPAEDGGALSHLRADYALLCLAIAPTPQAAVAGRAAAYSAVRAMARWSRVALVPTFTDPRVDASRFYDGEDWARLCQVRDAFDPDRALVANHGL